MHFEICSTELTRKKFSALHDLNVVRMRFVKSHTRSDTGTMMFTDRKPHYLTHWLAFFGRVAGCRTLWMHGRAHTQKKEIQDYTINAHSCKWHRVYMMLSGVPSSWSKVLFALSHTHKWQLQTRIRHINISDRSLHTPQNGFAAAFNQTVSHQDGDDHKSRRSS